MPKTIIYISILLLLLNSCTHDANRYHIKGIDVSRYQKKINWTRVGQQQLDFVFMKATEGTDLQDVTFSYNWTESKKVHLKRGAYHFFRPRKSVEWQVKNFTRTVRLEEGDLPPVLDIEDFKGLEMNQIIEKARTWLALIEAHYNIRPIIYTSLDPYKRHFQNAFPNHIFWIANYSRTAPPLDHQALFWQYSQTGKLKGIQGNVDLNIFAGSKKDLEKLN